MKTGAELISQERKEQLEKHGWTAEHDAKYTNGELIKAALFCFVPTAFEWPFTWSGDFREKILTKDEISRKAVGGALIAAEIDRLQRAEQTKGE